MVQYDFCGLVYNAEWGGIHVNTDGQLRYDWAGSGFYPYESGLVLPDGEWAFVALVIEPTQATLYMQPDVGLLQSATNVGTHDPAWNDITWIGRDPAWRMFDGLTDDVRIYDTALDANEIAVIVPEPASMTLLSLCGLSLLRRRKR